MAGRDGTKKAAKATAGRRLLIGVGAGAGAFVAAAALATGSAAPAKADFEDLLDPIIQPFLTSLTDSIAIFDPAAALDLTSWTDTFLASLNSIDFLLPTVAEPAGVVGAASDMTAGTWELPLTMAIGTEPTIQAAIGAGDPSTLLVDTGSGGLVIPWQELGTNDFSALQELFKLGLPDNYGLSGYSGGVEYLYLTYNDVPVDYGTDGADILSTNSPVDVEVLSWSTNPNDIFENFQSFLSGNHVDGILGIGENTAGPTATPFESYGGVLVDIPHDQLVVGGGNPFPDAVSTGGNPVSNVLESVNGGTQVAVWNNIDSGGVFGTIPSSLAPSGSVPPGTEIAVYNTAHQLLYSYNTSDQFQIGPGQFVDSGPTPVSGTDIDSGVIPFLHHAVYLDYAGDRTYFGPLTS